MLFIWALDTKRTRINRYRSYGWSWGKIADIYKALLQQLGGGVWVHVLKRTPSSQKRVLYFQVIQRNQEVADLFFYNHLRFLPSNPIHLDWVIDLKR